MIRRDEPPGGHLPTEVVEVDDRRLPTRQGVSYGCFESERHTTWIPKNKIYAVVKWLRDKFLSPYL